jgi:hypothetical protein
VDTLTAQVPFVAAILVLWLAFDWLREAAKPTE